MAEEDPKKDSVEGDSIAGKVKAAAREGAIEGAKLGMQQAFEEMVKGLEKSGFKLDDIPGSLAKILAKAFNEA